MEWVVLFAVIGLSFVNGSNDTFKGVATLFGTGTTEYRPALRIAVACTFAGSLTAIGLGAALAKQFSGSGLVPSVALNDPAFVAAVVLGAALTVFLATRFGFPVSTTHALTGALVGGAIRAVGVDGIHFSALKSFFVPLLTSPVIAMALTGTLYPLLSAARRRLKIERHTCICIGGVYRPLVAGFPDGLAFAQGDQIVRVESNANCVSKYSGEVLGIELHWLLDRLHFLSSGAVSFARGLNDTPKIFGLFLLLPAVSTSIGPWIVGVVMAMGALLDARKVAETMSHRITRMNHGQGLTANLVTSMLVIFASKWGMPVSTTHVSCGSLFAIGAASGTAQWRTMAQIALAWVVTLPIAAAFAFLVCTLAKLTLV